MKKLFKNKVNIKDKKGLNSIELVIGVLIALLLFATFLDFLSISNKMQAMTTTSTYLSRVLSNQGCIAKNPNSCVDSSGNTGYNTEYIKNKNFVTSKELYENINNIMKREKIEAKDWTVKINNHILNENTNTKLFNFRERIEISIEINYKWNMLSQLIPIITKNGTLKSKQSIVSSYKFRNDNGENGFDYGQ